MMCLEVGSSSVGKRMMRITAGRPRIVGVVNGVNKFSFILVVKDCCGFLS